jgi:hypothetical protein
MSLSLRTEPQQKMYVLYETYVMYVVRLYAMYVVYVVRSYALYVCTQCTLCTFGPLDRQQPETPVDWLRSTTPPT